MVKLTLPSYLFALLPADAQSRRCSQRSVLVGASTWPEVIDQIERDFPVLAERVVKKDAVGIAPSFAVFINGQLMPGHRIPEQLHEADEVTIIATMAGGET